MMCGINRTKNNNNNNIVLREISGMPSTDIIFDVIRIFCFTFFFRYDFATIMRIWIVAFNMWLLFFFPRII